MRSRKPRQSLTGRTARVLDCARHLRGTRVWGFVLLALSWTPACGTSDAGTRATGEGSGGNSSTGGGSGGSSTGGNSSGDASVGGSSTGGSSTDGIDANSTEGNSTDGDSTDRNSSDGVSTDGDSSDVSSPDAEPISSWIRQFGTNGDDVASSVAVDGSGNVYVAGHVTGSLPGQTSAGGDFDDFVRKYDAAGTELWTRQFGSADLDHASVSVDGVGNVFVAGVTGAALPGQTSAGAWDVFVRKYDGSGIELWTREFGSSGHDGGWVTADDSGNVYVSGFTENGLPGQSTDVDAGSGLDAGTGADSDIALWRYAFVRKYDGAGTELWTRQFGANGGHVLASAASVDADGSVYVAGITDDVLPGQTSAGGEDAFVRKYDSAGTELWTRQFGSSATDDARSVGVDAGGNLYVAGLTNGTLPGQTSAGNTDAYLRKYDGAGTEVWTRQFGTSAYDGATSVRIRAGILYVGGETSGTLPGQTRAGSTDAYLRKYDDTGTELETRQFGTTGIEQNLSVSISGNGSIYVAGSTDGTFPGQTSAGLFDVFLAKLAPCRAAEVFALRIRRATPTNFVESAHAPAAAVEAWSGS